MEIPSYFQVKYYLLITVIILFDLCAVPQLGAAAMHSILRTLQSFCQVTHPLVLRASLQLSGVGRGGEGG